MPRDANLSWLRVERWIEDARAPLIALCGERPDARAHADAVFDCVVDGSPQRSDPLPQLDPERQMTPDGFERPNMVGYVS
jgi:amylosucrase